jgi:hypothetical protein
MLCPKGGLSLIEGEYSRNPVSRRPARGDSLRLSRSMTLVQITTGIDDASACTPPLTVGSTPWRST